MESTEEVALLDDTARCAIVALLGMAFLLSVAVMLLSGSYLVLFPLLNWALPPKLCVIGLLISAIAVALCCSVPVVHLDLHMLYAPFLVWLVSLWVFTSQTKGASNYLVVEPSIIALLTCAYFGRFVIGRYISAARRLPICLTIAVIVLIAAGALTRFIPTIPD